MTAGPTSIRHVERSRTVTLEVQPADTLALGEAVEILQQGVVDKMEDLKGKTILISSAANTTYWPWLMATYKLDPTPGRHTQYEGNKRIGTVPPAPTCMPPPGV